MVTCLPIDQEVLDLIPSSAEDFTLMDNFSTACTDWVFPCFIILCPCSVLRCLWTRFLHSADHRSGEDLQLCSCSFTSSWYRVNWYKGTLKKKKNPLSKLNYYVMYKTKVCVLKQKYKLNFYPQKSKTFSRNLQIG